MNNRGQTIFLSVVVGVFIFLFGVLFISFIELEVDHAIGQNESGMAETVTPNLDCGSSTSPNSDVSDGTKLSCLASELAVPYIIIVILSAAGAAITARFLK